MNRTLYFPRAMGKDNLASDPVGPCAQGAYFLNQIKGLTIEKLNALVPFLCAQEGPFADFHAATGLRRGTMRRVADANNSIPDPHDRALFAQWLFSGIPDPADAHIERMNDRRMYFEVIMLPPNQPIPGAIDVPCASAEPVCVDAERVAV